jgi:uncharacterized protein (TIGR02145 family)
MKNLIFACCGAADKGRAEETCKKLSAVGLNIEIAGLSNDDDMELEDGIGAARFVLVFFSNQAASESEALDRHLKIAMHSAQKLSNDRVFIIPVRFDKCDVPKSVSHLQLIDLFKEEGFDQIVETIRGELALYIDNRDGQVYRTIEIGGVTWLAENLNYEVKDSWWYDNDRNNGRPFGRLYTWDAAQSGCPDGWHIPTVAEWEQLAASVGGTWDFVKSAPAYKALTEEGGGFQAVFGGQHERKPFDAFYDRGTTGMYWGGNDHTGIYTFIFGRAVGRLLSSKADQEELENGYSCRCVKDS